MDYKFLHKVVDQIVSETRIDYDEGISSPVLLPFFTLHYSLTEKGPNYFIDVQKESIYHFKKHCIDIYGLNEEEISYVWEEYREIIYNKIYVVKEEK